MSYAHRIPTTVDRFSDEERHVIMKMITDELVWATDRARPTLVSLLKKVEGADTVLFTQRANETET